MTPLDERPTHAPDGRPLASSPDTLCADALCALAAGHAGSHDPDFSDATDARQDAARADGRDLDAELAAARQRIADAAARRHRLANPPPPVHYDSAEQQDLFGA